MSLRNDPPATVEELERQMARVVCAQICKQQGFTGVKESALSTLSEVRACMLSLSKVHQNHFSVVPRHSDTPFTLVGPFPF